MCDHPPQWTADNIGVLGYGSLLSDPGNDIRPHVIHRIPWVTPWPIEYARTSKGRGGAPTLVIHPSGQPVTGAILVLDLNVPHLATVGEWLWIRENKPPRSRIKVMAAAGLLNVVYVHLKANIPDEKLT